MLVAYFISSIKHFSNCINVSQLTLYSVSNIFQAVLMLVPYFISSIKHFSNCVNVSQLTLYQVSSIF